MVVSTLLLERALGRRVDRGMIFLLPSKRVLWVRLTANDGRELIWDLEPGEEGYRVRRASTECQGRAVRVP